MVPWLEWLVWNFLPGAASSDVAVQQSAVRHANLLPATGLLEVGLGKKRTLAQHTRFIQSRASMNPEFLE